MDSTDTTNNAAIRVSAQAQPRREMGSMAQEPRKTVEYFSAYEAREDAFRLRVNALIPRKHGGPALFWEDFGRISFDRLHGTNGADQAYITSNPRDCLAFGTPRQVLSAAWMRARAAGDDSPPAVETVAQDFGITSILNQPIRSLSGGESVKLAMAKAFAAAGYSSRLTIASPFSWLSASNTVYFQKLCNRCQSLGIPVDVLALEEEDSKEAIGKSDAYLAPAEPKVGFSLLFKNVRMRLGSFLHQLHGVPAHAEVADCESLLTSPCLLVGENGQGKSVVAKILAGAVDFTGKARIGDSGGGRVRLLFQDVVTQTLLRNFDALATQVPQADSAACREIYDRIIDQAAQALIARGKLEPATKEDGVRTLLEIKTMLIATRLSAPCKALILDEPDWGLSRASSLALVSASISAAHSLGVAVILISHKPWWEPVAASILTADRSEADKNGAFRIRLTSEKKKAP